MPYKSAIFRQIGGFAAEDGELSGDSAPIKKAAPPN